MALTDSTLQLSTAQAISATAASTNIFDVTGAGSGNAPNQSFGNATSHGLDIGTGDGKETLHAVFLVTTTGTGTGTVTFAVQAAPDNGSNAPGTYTTLASSAAFTGTALVKGNIVDLPVPPYTSSADQIGPGMGLPRFYRFYYTVSGTATVSVSAFITSSPPLGYVSTQIANNFTAA